MSFLGFLFTIPKIPFELNRRIEKERGGQTPPKQEDSHEAKLASPIGIDVSSPMAVLLARKSAMLIRLKEKIDFHQTTWAAYQKNALTVRPERFWDYSSSNATMAEDVAVLLGDFEKSWNQIKEVVETHCKQTSILLAEKDKERVRLIEGNENEKMKLMGRITELESGTSGELEAVKLELKACQLRLSGEILRFDTEKKEVIDALKATHKAELEAKDAEKAREITEKTATLGQRISELETDYNNLNENYKASQAERTVLVRDKSLLQAELKKLGKVEAKGTKGLGAMPSVTSESKESDVSPGRTALDGKSPTTAKSAMPKKKAKKEKLRKVIR